MSDHLVRPPARPRGSLLVLHAWWGLNDFFKDFCSRLAREGFLVVAPDPYSGNIAKTIPAAEQLRARIRRSQAAEAILQSLQHLQADVDSRPTGLIGFSLGANFGLGLVAEQPRSFDAAVLFYGIRGGQYAPATCAFLGHFAEKDAYVSDSGRKQLERTLRGSGCTVDFHVYPRTRHWFFEHDRPEFEAEAAGLAWQRTVAFLHDRFSSR